MNVEISQKDQKLAKHPMYGKMANLENIRIFMQYHVFAVWDFINLQVS